MATADILHDFPFFTAVVIRPDAASRYMEGWLVQSGQLDKSGNVTDDRLHILPYFDRRVILEERTKLIAKRMTIFRAFNKTRF